MTGRILRPTCIQSFIEDPCVQCLALPILLPILGIGMGCMYIKDKVDKVSWAKHRTHITQALNLDVLAVNDDNRIFAFRYSQSIIYIVLESVVYQRSSDHAICQTIEKIHLPVPGGAANGLIYMVIRLKTSERVRHVDQILTHSARALQKSDWQGNAIYVCDHDDSSCSKPINIGNLNVRMPMVDYYGPMGGYFKILMDSALYQGP